MIGHDLPLTLAHLSGLPHGAGDEPIDRLLKLEKPKAVADELYLSVLSRRPDQEEIDIVEAFLKKMNHREKAIRHLTWALLSSVEFCVNH